MLLMLQSPTVNNGRFPRRTSHTHTYTHKHTYTHTANGLGSDMSSRKTRTGHSSLCTVPPLRSSLTLTTHITYSVPNLATASTLQWT